MRADKLGPCLAGHVGSEVRCAGFADADAYGAALSAAWREISASEGILRAHEAPRGFYRRI
ncbi:hypothetical protein DD563_05960 [Pelagicola sp. LXJ1103]|nr:hypothetical protein DD563_05960 [Pelagicola sp. LXJ1103]